MWPAALALTASAKGLCYSTLLIFKHSSHYGSVHLNSKYPAVSYELPGQLIGNNLCTCTRNILQVQKINIKNLIPCIIVVASYLLTPVHSRI